jgi:fibronectin type 3 domain-containing protein
VIDPPYLGAVGNQTTNENTPVSFTLTSTDPENAGVEYIVVDATTEEAPTNVTVSINQSTGQVTLTPAAGFTGVESLLVGVRGSAAADQNLAYDTQQITLTVEIPTSTTAVAGAGAELDLSNAYNRVGITTDGATFTGGLDGVGYAYSATNTGTSVNWNGLSFNLGAAGTNNVVQATGQTIQLPAGQYSQLDLLATGVLGNQTAQTFTVTYTDGATTTLTQSLSDWFTSQKYQGEAVALATPYRNTAAGGADHRTFNIYGYEIDLDNGRTVSSITLPDDSKVEVLAISLGAPVVAPTNVVATASSPDEIDLTWTAATGAVTGYDIIRSTVSGGPYTTLLNATPLVPGTTSFQDTTAVPGNTYYYVIQSVNVSMDSPLSNQASATTPTTSSNLEVDLTEDFDATGITTKGTKFSSGLDGLNNALPANQLGTSVTSGGTDFTLGQADTLNVVAAVGQTITLPAGQYSQLRFLATGVQGNQLNQTFTILYTDGTEATLTQSLSDWYTPQHYAGESIAATTTYRTTAAGGVDNRPFNVYGYTINLDSSKTVSALILPDNRFVRILAVSMVAPVAAPTGLTASTTSPNIVNLSWTASASAATGYNVYRGTTSGGESSSPLNSTPLAAGTTSYQDTTAVAGNTYYYVVKAVNASALSSISNEVTVAIPATSTNTSVDLASNYNLTGITVKGTKFTGGLDGVGNALSLANVGSSATVGGVTFNLGAAGVNDVVQAAGQTVGLPTGQFSQLQFLATAVNGNQKNQTFTVHYTDGTSTTITQSISDWFTPQHFAGESVAISSPYRNTSAGGTDNRTFDVYSYTIALDSSKTVSSITLPNNSHVEVLAMTAVQ